MSTRDNDFDSSTAIYCEHIFFFRCRCPRGSSGTHCARPYTQIFIHCCRCLLWSRRTFPFNAFHLLAFFVCLLLCCVKCQHTTRAHLSHQRRCFVSSRVNKKKNNNGRITLKRNNAVIKIMIWLMQRKRRNTCAMALETLVQIHEHNNMHMINDWMMMVRPPWPFAYCLLGNIFQIPFWLWVLAKFLLTRYSPCFHIFQLTKLLQVFRSSHRVPQPGSSKLDTQRLCNVDQQAIQHRKYSGWKTAFVWTCRTVDTHWSTVSFTLFLLQVQI